MNRPPSVTPVTGRARPRAGLGVFTRFMTLPIPVTTTAASAHGNDGLLFPDQYEARNKDQIHLRRVCINYPTGFTNVIKLV